MTEEGVIILEAMMMIKKILGLIVILCLVAVFAVVGPVFIAVGHLISDRTKA